MKLEQKTAFPEEEGTTLVFQAAPAKQVEVDVRYPLWVAPGALKLTVNGEPQKINVGPGQYVAVTREWKQGDILHVETPMALHTEMLPHSSDYVSILYGPLVLAGKLGLQGLTESDFNRQAMDAKKRLPPATGPVIIQPVAAIVAHLKPVEGQPLTFVSDGLINPRDVRMVPFYKLYNERYTVYWQIVDAVASQRAESKEPAN